MTTEDLIKMKECLQLYNSMIATGQVHSPRSLALGLEVAELLISTIKAEEVLKAEPDLEKMFVKDRDVVITLMIPFGMSIKDIVEKVFKTEPLIKAVWFGGADVEEVTVIKAKELLQQKLNEWKT